ETGIGVEQAVGAAGRGADVAVAVDHDEGVAALERAPRPRRRSRRRNVERRFRDRLVQQLRECGALGRHGTPVNSFLFPAPARAAAPSWRAPTAGPAYATNDRPEHNPWPCG